MTRNIKETNSKTFALNFEGQEILVHYSRDFFSGYDHFEFLSPYRPARPIPVSETGYSSHFAPTCDVDVTNAEIYAHTLLLVLMDDRCPINYDINQLDLF